MKKKGGKSSGPKNKKFIKKSKKILKNALFYKNEEDPEQAEIEDAGEDENFKDVSYLLEDTAPKKRKKGSTSPSFLFPALYLTCTPFPFFFLTFYFQRLFQKKRKNKKKKTMTTKNPLPTLFSFPP